MATKPKAKGRKRGGRNKGFWYLKGRGWVVTEGQSRVALRDESGAAYKRQDTSPTELKEAYARHLKEREEEAKRIDNTSNRTVQEICFALLDHDKKESSPSTYNARASYLFDFCSGFPAAYRNKKQRPPKARLHKGYGDKRASDIIKHDVEQWITVHEGWARQGSARMAIQTVRRAFRYAVDMGLLTENPIKGIKVPTGRQRVTYFTEDQEKALLKYANPALSLAIKACILTGARPGKEFAKLTDKQVHETPKGQEWRFAPHECKTKKPRVIRVPPEIAEVVRTQIKCRKGPVFRTRKGEPWTDRKLQEQFRRLKSKLARHRVTLDGDACMYSCRHTFAKRVLGGYWTGKPTTTETLAGLMGNSPDICWKHYAQWCDSYTEPLWEAIKQD